MVTASPAIVPMLLLLPLIALGGICNDKLPSCGAWAKDEHCVTNPDYMRKMCPLACGICNHTCADRHTACPEWMMLGECDKNHDFMLRECPISCGLCTPECIDHMPECPGW